MPIDSSALSSAALVPRADGPRGPRLATELLQLILRELSAPLFGPEPTEGDPSGSSWLADSIWATEDQLAKCMRVSREFLNLCQPLLYANVRLLDTTEPSFVADKRAVERRLEKLLQVLKDCPDVARLVKSVALGNTSCHSDEAAEEFDVWPSTLQRLESLRHVKMPLSYFHLPPPQLPRVRPRLLSLDVFAEWPSGRETADLCAAVPLNFDLAQLRRLSVEFFWAEDRRVLTWLESLPLGLASLQLDVDNAFSGETMRTADVNAILRRHGPTLGHLRLSADVLRTPGVPLLALSAACPALVSFGWDTGTISSWPTGPTLMAGPGLQVVVPPLVGLTTFLAELLHGGHPRLATLELGSGSSGIDLDTGETIPDPDFAAALALVRVLVRDKALPRLREIVLPHVSFAAGPLDWDVDMQAQALRACGLALVDKEGTTLADD